MYTSIAQKKSKGKSSYKNIKFYRNVAVAATAERKKMSSMDFYNGLL